MARIKINVEDAIDPILEEVHDNWVSRLDEKGEHIFVSSHETLGVISEEVDEYKKEVRKNNKDHQRKELLDIIVACLHGIASIDNGGQDW